MGKLRACLLIATAFLVPLVGSGCFPQLVAPIPVQPWVPDRMEEKYCHKTDFETPVMPPIRPGFPEPTCEDPPSVRRVLRAMPHVTRGVPYIYEEFRDDVQVVTEKIKDSIDPPRFYPLLGPAQLHHCHWRCTIYYTETTESAYPFPYRCRKPRTEVVYMDTDHLHLYPCGTPETQQEIARDLTNR